MMVKVHNLNVHPYKEEFRGRMIVIPANDCIEMDEDEAVYFMESFVYPKKDSQGRPDPLFFKKLKIERPKVETTVDPLVCHANGQRAASAEDLSKLLSAFSHMAAAKDAGLEAEVSSKKNLELKKENKELKGRLDRVEDENKELRGWIEQIKEKLGLSSEIPDEASV